MRTLALALAAAAALAPAAAATTSVSFRLVGRGTPVPVNIGQGPCPEGITLMSIRSAAGTRVGGARICVLTISQTRAPDDERLQSIVQTVRETDSLPGGSIVSRQTQTFVFDRDQVHSTATFRGRVVGGTGRYAHARGTVSGGGRTVDGVAAWRVTIRLSPS